MATEPIELEDWQTLITAIFGAGLLRDPSET